MTMYVIVCVFVISLHTDFNSIEDTAQRGGKKRFLNSEPCALFSFVVLSFSQKLKTLAREEALKLKDPSRSLRYAIACVFLQLVLLPISLTWSFC